MSILTGTFTIFVGIGSFIYHASYSMLGGKLDISVMYLIITQFCCTVIARFISHEQDITKIAWKGNGFVLLGLCSAAVLFTYRMTPTLTMGGIQEPLIVGMFLLGAFGIAVPATCTVYTKSTHLEEHDQQSRCFWPCCCVRVEQRPRSWMYTVLAVLSFVVAFFAASRTRTIYVLEILSVTQYGMCSWLSRYFSHTCSFEVNACTWATQANSRKLNCHPTLLVVRLLLHHLHPPTSKAMRMMMRMTAVKRLHGLATGLGGDIETYFGYDRKHAAHTADSNSPTPSALPAPKRSKKEWVAMFTTQER